MSKLSQLLRKFANRHDSSESGGQYMSKFRASENNPPLPTSPLESIFYAHDGRTSDKWHHYFRIYEEEFGFIRRRDVKLLEIGVQAGGSLQIWRKFLGEKATIFGVDIDPNCRNLDTDDICVRIGSQNDPEFLRRVVSEMGGLDIVIDDGSHIGSDQIASFKALFPLMATDGVYLIEDLQTAYWREYNGGVDREGTIVSFAKDLIDDLNGWYHHSPAKSLATAKTEIGRIAFYNAIVAIRKSAGDSPQTVLTGDAVR